MIQKINSRLYPLSKDERLYAPLDKIIPEPKTLYFIHLYLSIDKEMNTRG